MFFCKKRKDGGKTSPVDAYFLIEWKNFISIAILKFNKGGREEFHTHAFNAVTWFVKGDLVEEDVSGDTYKYTRSLIPKVTPKDKNHRVKALTDSYCFTIRGKWSDKWLEYEDDTRQVTEFTHGRKIVNQYVGLDTEF